MAYTLHQELTDATLEPAFQTINSKRLALKIARTIVKTYKCRVANTDVHAIVVCNAEDLAIATFKTGARMGGP
jgi:hypothetical protein